MDMLYIVSIVVLLHEVPISEGACQDVDTRACILMHTDDPTVCQNTQMAASICPKFCNLCPDNNLTTILTCYDCKDVSRNAADCTTQKLCGVGERCMISVFHSQIDGRYEYKMNCASLDHCEGREYLGILGRREPSARTLSTDCCSEDLCNNPALTNTTSTPPATTTITTEATTSSPSSTTVPASVISSTSMFPTTACRRDVEVLIEESFRISRSEVVAVKDFAKDLVNQIPLGTQAGNIGFALFDTEVRERVGLFSDAHIASEAIDHLTFAHRHSTAVDINEVIQFLAHDTLATGRASVEKVAVLIIDQHAQQEMISAHGHSHPHLPHVDLSPLQHVSHDVIVINVGSSHLDDVFTQLATDPNHVLNVPDYGDLSTIISALVSLICQ